MRTISKSYPQYYKEILRLGLPILVGQLGVIAVGFADNIMVGRHSTAELASASFVNNIFNVAIFLCMGFTYGLTPLIGSLFTSGNHRDIGRTLLTGTKVNLLFASTITLLMGIVYLFLDRMGQPRELLPHIRPYYLIYLAGIIPISLFNVFAQWSYAIRNTVMPTIIVLISNGVNVLGNYLFIGGNWGCPELGLIGAGLSTLTSRILCPAAIIAIFLYNKNYRSYREGFSPRIAKVTSAWKVTVTSFPIGLQMAMETAAFSGSAIIAGMLDNGTLALAAFQVLVIVGTLGFCIYYSMATSVSVMVANAMGERDMPKVRKIGWAGYHVIITIATISCTIFYFGGHYLISFFSDNDQALIALASAQIIPLIIYQLGDATQINFAGALRGTANVMPMLWIAFVSYIVIGLPSTWLLAHTLGLGLQGIFLSFSASLFTAGALFLFFFLESSRTAPKPH